MDAKSIKTKLLGAIGSEAEALREFFLLREAENRAVDVPASLRQSIADKLRVSEQRRDLAQLSFRMGSRAEALRLATEAFALLRPLLDDLGIAADSAVLEVDGEPSLPTLDADVTADHELRFERLLAAHAALRSRLAPIALDARGRKWLRVRRFGMALMVAAAIPLVGVMWARRDRTIVRASASYGPEYRPEQVLDGSEYTHWLLPDRTLGYIDFDLVPPRRVTTVSILNGFDPPTYGVYDFRLEAYSNGKLVKMHDATFRGQVPQPKPVFANVPFPTIVEVDKVRLVVKSHRELGASLAEVVIR